MNIILSRMKKKERKHRTIINHKAGKVIGYPNKTRNLTIMIIIHKKTRRKNQTIKYHKTLKVNKYLNKLRILASKEK